MQRLYSFVTKKMKVKITTVTLIMLVCYFTLFKKDCVTPIYTKYTANDNVTVVTAYWNLGSFQKGRMIFKTFSTNTYKKWMTTFRYMTNPLVVFVDDEKVANHFRNLRRNLSDITKIILIDKAEMWSFGLKTKIKNIFSKPEYPHFSPDTTVPEYSCAQHAKFDSLQMAIEKNYFHTKHFTWLDIGYFRQNINCKQHFKIVLPPDFNPNRISCTQVYTFEDDSIKTIIYEHKVWVGGGIYLGKSDIILKFIKQYRQATEKSINMSLVSTDQQMLYGMFSQEGRKLFKPLIELQTYASGKWNDWFYLGFLCHRYVDMNNKS